MVVLILQARKKEIHLGDDIKPGNYFIIIINSCIPENRKYSRNHYIIKESRNARIFNRLLLLQLLLDYPSTT